MPEVYNSNRNSELENKWEIIQIHGIRANRKTTRTKGKVRYDSRNRTNEQDKDIKSQKICILKNYHNGDRGRREGNWSKISQKR